MVAVDTKVLVRLLTGDEPKQAAVARALFDTDEVWIAKTVLLETGWVLRSLYGFDQTAICDGLTKLLGLRNVHAEDAPSLAAALSLAAQGIDLADAVHLCSRPVGAEFMSFDRHFVRRARRLGVSGVTALP